MSKPSPDYDVTARPAMPPPGTADNGTGMAKGASPGMAKLADPRHNAMRGDAR